MRYRVPKHDGYAYHLICLAFDTFEDRKIGPHFDIDASSLHYVTWRAKTPGGELWLLANLPLEAIAEDTDS